MRTSVHTEVPALKGRAIAASVAGAATIRSIDNGSIIQRVPPKGWSPLKATNAELAYYGFPARPTGSNLKANTAAWDRQWSNYSGVVAVSACLDPHTSFDSDGNIWAGVVDEGYTNYTEAYARFPEPQIGSGCYYKQQYSSWTGIGGYNTPALIQSGTADGFDVPGPPYRGSDDHVGVFTETFDTNSHTPGVDWYSPGFVNRGDSLSNATTYIPASGSTAAHAQYYWHDGTNGKIVTLDQYSTETFGGGSWSISHSYNGNHADFINEVKPGLDISPAADQPWTYAAATLGGTETGDVGNWSHIDLWAEGQTTHLKALGLSPPYIQTLSSWTMHHFRCD